MKVLHLTNYFFPEYSGTTTRLYNIVSRLPFEIQILTSDKVVKGGVIPLKQEQFGNITVNRLPLNIGGSEGKPTIWNSINAVRQDKKILVDFALKQRFDIIHGHNSVVFGQAGKSIAGKTHRPFVFEYHGLAHESASGAFKSVKASYIQYTDKQVMRKSDHVITLSNRLKEWIRDNYKMPESRMAVVPNGADITRFAPGAVLRNKAIEVKKKLGIQGKIVMYAGVMDAINGIDDLALIASQIINERRDVCFVFVGGPADNRSLVDLLDRFPQNAKLIPNVPYDDMPAYYEMCDVFAIPRPSTISAETIVPLKLLEAMSTGKPVVASDVGGLSEVIKHGENGYLFKKGNIESLKETLLSALEADNNLIGRNARQTITETYTWDKSVKLLLDVYAKLA